MGPKETPTAAVSTQVKGGPAWSYRICRRGENPWQLRDPPVMADLEFAEMRALLLSAVAKGNDPRSPSPFLHATSVLRKALWIFGERRELYSHWLVRFPKSRKGCIDFEDAAMRGKWFSEHNNDTSLLEEYVQKCRAYTEKDSELVYLIRPNLEDIQWWDESTKEWQHCLHSAKSQHWMSLLVADKISGGHSADAFLQSGSASSEVSLFNLAALLEPRGPRLLFLGIKAHRHGVWAGFKGLSYAL